MKRIIVACANGVATSQAIASRVNKMLKDSQIAAKVDAVNIKSLDREIRDCVAYITITKQTKEYPVPVINGIAFLTGMNREAEFEKLVAACK